MKKLLKRQTIFPVAMLCCIMLGLFSNAVYGSADSFSNAAAKEEALRSTPALCTEFTIHTSNAINSVGNFNTAPASFKNTVTGSSDSAKMIEQSFRRKFARYFFYMRNLLLRFRQCEIIFPFHYFW